MSIKRLIFAIILINLATTIRAETINCTAITSLPATITAQGIYCLTGNLATSQSSGYAITINANNVTIDLNGWKVGGQGAGTGTATYGIYSAANNVTIKNGIVRGFYFGIELDGSGAVVQDMLVDSNTRVGIFTYGPGALVEHNQVVNTGGTTAFTNTNVLALVVYGAGSNVNNNMVSGLIPVGNGNEYGIDIEVGANTTARNNVVSNSALPTGGGISYGILLNDGIALNNTLSEYNYGIANYGGSIYAYNTALNCTTSYYGGTAGAGNSP
jgi:hypothetical protein